LKAGKAAKQVEATIQKSTPGSESIIAIAGRRPLAGK